MENLSQPYYIEKRRDCHHAELSGKWELAFCDEPLREGETPEFDLQVSVPASIYRSLNEAGVLPDPYFGENSHQYAWVDSKVWVYRKRFTLDAVPDAGREDAFLCFDGVGYTARVWLNGELLGSHAGMFGGPVCSVAGKLKKDNELIVEVKAFNYDKTGDMRFWRGTVSTGWRSRIPEIIPWNIARDEETGNGDFNVFGIWRPVRLEVVPKTHLARPYLYTKSLEGDRAVLSLELSIATDQINELNCVLSAPDWNFTFSYFDGLSGALSDETVTVDVELTDPDSGETVYREAEEYVLNDYERYGVNEKFRECQFYRREIALSGIKPWFPNGLGEPKLYRVTIRLSQNGVLLDTLCFDTGIRVIAQEESTGRKYRQRWDRYWFSVNGRKIFLKGMNWTPLDYLYNTDPEEYRWALEEVKACGIQLLRVWNGGGMPEEDVFYELCDRLGIMVWQDNFIANQTTPQWREKELENQVCYNLFRIRNHPSLAVHCGGNEFSPYTEGNNASMFVIQRNIEDLDPSRKFYRTSPDRGSYHGYRNMDASWLRKLFKELPFMAESGTHSFPNFKSIRQNIPENEWEGKLDLTAEDFERRFPGLANHLTEFKRNRCLVMRGRVSHVVDLKDCDLRTMCEATQVAAGEYYRFLIQSLRENYPKTVGVMPWVFKRNWTTVAVQLVDGMGEPVAPYYEVKKAYRPVIVFAALEQVIYTPGEEFCVPVKVINDSETPFEGEAVIEVYNRRFEKISEERTAVSVAPEEYGKTALLPRVCLSGKLGVGHFYIRTRLLKNGEEISASFYPLYCVETLENGQSFEEYRSQPVENILFEKGPFMRGEIAETRSRLTVKILKKTVQGDRTHLTFTVRADAPAYPVMLEAAEDKTVSFQSDNYFFLDAGEEKTVEMTVRNKGELDRGLTLRVASWNSEPQLLPF